MDYKPTAPCSCSVCVRMCETRPCWPTPAGAAVIIAAGYSNQFMLDYYMSLDNIYIYILAPAIVGHETLRAPLWPTGRCTFLTVDGRCEIHDIKPLEGLVASCTVPHPGLHEDIAHTWDTDEGRQLVAEWRKTYDLLT